MPRVEMDRPEIGIGTWSLHWPELRASVRKHVAAELRDGKWDLKPKDIPLAVHIYTEDSTPAAVITLKVYYHPTAERTADLERRFDAMGHQIGVENSWLCLLSKEGQRLIEVIGIEIHESAWALSKS